jgi:arabinan endo-1,5-alpha-L-arabinosidase
MEDLDDNEVAQAVYDDLQVVDTTITDIELPTTGTRDTIISWDSSHPESISTEGIVKRPEPGEGNVEVELTATISKGQTTLLKTFSVSVTEKSEGRLAAYYSFNGDLSNSADTEFEAGVVTGDIINNEGGEITFAEGVISGQQAAYFDGQSGVRLPRGLITNHTYSVSLWMNPDELSQFTPAFFGARTENDWVSIVPSGPVNNETMVWSGSQTWYDAPSGMQIPIGEWSHIVFTVDDGILNLYINNEPVFEGSNFPDVFTTADASFGLGVNYWDVPFKGYMDELRIYDNIVLSPIEVEELFNGLD